MAGHHRVFIAQVHRTRIGSPFVIAIMNAALAAGEGIVCGYDVNGGFLLASDIVKGARCVKALPPATQYCPSSPY